MIPPDEQLHVLASQIEALLFVSGEPLSKRALAEACQVSVEQVSEALALLTRRLEQTGSALQIVDVAHGKQLRTRPHYFPVIQRLQPNKPTPLSHAALESLAIILYKQPITRVEIDTIRGVNSTSALNTLLEKGLIRECGRLEVPGRPLLYGTTDEALKRLGLESLDQLPPLEQVKELSTLPQLQFPLNDTKSIPS